MTSDERRAFEEMAASIGPPITGRPEAPAITVGLGPDAFSLQGRAFELLDWLARSLAAPALQQGGLSYDEARDTLLRSCFTAKLHGAEAAIADLESLLAQPPREWHILRPLRAALPRDPFQIGACTVQRGLPAKLGLGEGWLGEDEFPALTIATMVVARDDDTAAVLAEQHFGEAFGLVQVFDQQGSPTLGDARAIVNDKGTISVNLDPRRAFYFSGFIAKDGELPPRLQPASDAAARSMDKRTDWERRVIAAARWFSNGMASPWPSEKLVSLFVALEALFVAGRSESGNKKGYIADRLTARLAVDGRTSEEQRAWLISLYDHRNDAVHEARDFLDDFEVAELGKLVGRSMHWAMDHLVSDHRREHRPCADFADVMQCEFRR